MARTPFAPRRAGAALVAVCMAAASAQAAPAQPPARTPAAAEAISPNDTLEVAVFQTPDLSRTVQVDSGGRILLPLIGEVDAAGRTPEQLSQGIEDALSRKYMRDPQVTVTVKNSTSQKVTVDGAVMKPGIYPLMGSTTLLQAVALAEGPDPKQANTHKVAVFRGGASDARAVYDLEAIRDGKAADPAIYPRDVVVVTASGGKNFLQTISGLAPLAGALRRW